MLKVLIVDDEAVVRRGIVLGIDWASLGCAVVGEAANGEEGLAAAERYSPNLIITDVRMPHMDGIEMMRVLRERGSTAHVIVLTAYNDFDYARSALRFGAADYLLKPFRDQELVAAIERVREKAEAFSSRSAQDDLLALPKGDKMEFIVQKAVELGVSRIVPYLSKNCVSRPDKTEKKVERWRKIAAEAAKQCGRGRLPEGAAVVPVAQAIAQAAESETALFFYENEKRTGLHDALAGGVRDTVSLMVGPEGGFDPAEARAAVDAGLQSVSLGTRILRCETAPIAALAAVLYAGGNM